MSADRLILNRKIDSELSSVAFTIANGDALFASRQIGRPAKVAVRALDSVSAIN